MYLYVCIYVYKYLCIWAQGARPGRASAPDPHTRREQGLIRTRLAIKGFFYLRF